jgi:hypothetical protein
MSSPALLGSFVIFQTINCGKILLGVLKYQKGLESTKH